MIPIEVTANEATKKQGKHFNNKSVKPHVKGKKKPAYQKKSADVKAKKVAKHLDAREQSGLVPYRYDEDGKLELLLITSSHKNNWGFPKGGQEKKLSGPVNAAKEAFEEAGISGKKKLHKLGHYVYNKGSTGRDQVVTMYGMEVTKEHKNWPEKTMRSRRWFKFKDAVRLIPKELVVFTSRLKKELKK